MTLFDQNTAAFVAIGSALRDVAAALQSLCELERERLNLEHPVKGIARDATITHPQTDEEKLYEAQGNTDETDEEWIGLGRREAAFSKAEAGRREARGGVTPTRGK